jgi:hypothetical protein
MRSPASPGCRATPSGGPVARLFAILVAAAGLQRAALAGDAPPSPSPAMGWLHPGATITMTWHVLSHPGHSTDFKPDENGGWVGSDGTHLSASDRPGNSAAGVSQATVSCVESGRAWVVADTFTDMRLLGFRDPLAQGRPKTFTVPLEQCDYWMDPARLGRLASDAASQTVVQPVRWTAGDKPVDAIRVTVVALGRLLDHVYDRSTGLCVHGAEADTGAAPQLKYTAPGDAAAGDTLLTAFDVVNVRDRHTPWATEPLPAWARQFQVLHYGGTAASPNPWLGGPPTPLRLDVTRVDAGEGWLGLATNGWAIVRGQTTPPVKTLMQCGRDQYDTFVAGPAALAKLTAGQVLDDDPVTRVRTVVTDANGSRVTITASSGGLLVTHTFDVQTGMLVATSRTDQQTKITTSFTLDGQE